MRQRINIAIAIEIDADQASSLEWVDGWTSPHDGQVPVDGLTALGQVLSDVMATNAIKAVPSHLDANVGPVRINVSTPYEPHTIVGFF